MRAIVRTLYSPIYKPTGNLIPFYALNLLVHERVFRSIVLKGRTDI